MAELTNEELGALIGLSHSGVSRLLSGARTPKPETMRRIAEAFDVDLGKVLEAATSSTDPEKRARHFGRWFTELVRTTHPRDAALTG